MLRLRFFIVLSLAVLCFSSCRQQPTRDDVSWTLSAEQRDSLAFVRTHHFTVGYNFLLSADSMVLLTDLPSLDGDMERADSVIVRRGEPLVVAEWHKAAAESLSAYWIKVARDQESIGWAPESDLLRSVVPVDPISRFIHTFSNRKTHALTIIVACIAVVLLYRKVKRGQMHMILLRDIHSLYPTLLCLCTSLVAVLYVSLQAFQQDAWREFYYHPSLNPFLWSPLLGAFLAGVWLWLILLLAACDDIRWQLPPASAIVYFLGLLSMCLFLYLFFSLLPSVLLAFVCFPLCVLFFLWKWRKGAYTAYVCGHCGSPVSGQGRCPRCGALNR